MPRLNLQHIDLDDENDLPAREAIRADGSPVSYRQATQRRAEDGKNRYRAQRELKQPRFTTED